MASIQPLGDRVLVKPDSAEEKTASGLFIPDTAKEKPQEEQLSLLVAVKLKTVLKLK